jgi:hypothetical protein
MTPVRSLWQRPSPYVARRVEDPVAAPPSAAAQILRLQSAVGNRALARRLGELGDARRSTQPRSRARSLQRVVYPDMATMWTAVGSNFDDEFVADSVLRELYLDASDQLQNCDFVQVPGTAPQIGPQAVPPAAVPYRVDWDTAANLGLDPDYFDAAIIHELAHASAAEMYDRHGANQAELQWANMSLPAAVGAVNPVTGLAQNQLLSMQAQIRTISANWTDLEAEALADNADNTFTAPQYAHVDGRIQYALSTAYVHNDTVLGDLMYWLRAKDLDGSRTYAFARRMLNEANDRRREGLWAAPGEEVRRVDSQARWWQILTW